MPSFITRPKRRPNRPKGLNSFPRPMQREIPVSIVSVTAAGDDVTIVFNQIVNLNGIPQYLKNGSIAPIAAELTAPNTLVLTYPTPVGPPVPATSIAVPGEEPGIRSATGGYVTPTTVDV